MRNSVCKFRRCCGLPLYEMIRIVGAHLANSPAQFIIIDRGTTNEIGPTLSFDLDQKRDERYRLNCLPKTLKQTRISHQRIPPKKKTRKYHLVGEDTVQPIVIQADHPLQPFELIIFKGATSEDGGVSPLKLGAGHLGSGSGTNKSYPKLKEKQGGGVPCRPRPLCLPTPICDC
jgi:hypothetical protein